MLQDFRVNVKDDDDDDDVPTFNVALRFQSRNVRHMLLIICSAQV